MPGVSVMVWVPTVMVVPAYTVSRPWVSNWNVPVGTRAGVRGRRSPGSAEPSAPMSGVDQEVSAGLHDVPGGGLLGGRVGARLQDELRGAAGDHRRFLRETQRRGQLVRVAAIGEALLIPEARGDVGREYAGHRHDHHQLHQGVAPGAREWSAEGARRGSWA